MRGIPYDCNRCGSRETFHPEQAFLTARGTQLIYLWNCENGAGPVSSAIWSRLELEAALANPVMVDPDADALVEAMLSGVS